MSLPLLVSWEEDLTSSRCPDVAEDGFSVVLRTSSMASFSLSCRIGLKIVTYLQDRDSNDLDQNTLFSTIGFSLPQIGPALWVKLLESTEAPDVILPSSIGSE